METYIVRFDLDGPLVLQHRLHLDAILGCVLGGIEELPILRDPVSEIFRCSQAMFVRPSLVGTQLQDRIQTILDVKTRQYLVDRAPGITALPTKLLNSVQKLPELGGKQRLN